MIYEIRNYWIDPAHFDEWIAWFREKVTPVFEGGYFMNGGFFIFKHEIFDYMREGEELVHEPFNRLIKKHQVIAYRYDGFWACMDTYKDKTMFDEMYAQGQTPWTVWESMTPASNTCSREASARRGTGCGSPPS